MISERTLKKWRKEALVDLVDHKMLVAGDGDGVDTSFHIDEVKELSSRILQLTQELMDQHLLKQRKG
jgi:hypothetical protein